jgi:hypothetical protein
MRAWLLVAISAFLTILIVQAPEFAQRPVNRPLVIVPDARANSWIDCPDTE